VGKILLLHHSTLGVPTSGISRIELLPSYPSRQKLDEGMNPTLHAPISFPWCFKKKKSHQFFENFPRPIKTWRNILEQEIIECSPTH
jgi:hypothetical protein